MPIARDEEHLFARRHYQIDGVVPHDTLEIRRELCRRMTRRCNAQRCLDGLGGPADLARNAVGNADRPPLVGEPAGVVERCGRATTEDQHIRHGNGAFRSGNVRRAVGGDCRGSILGNGAPGSGGMKRGCCASAPLRRRYLTSAVIFASICWMAASVILWTPPSMEANGTLYSASPLSFDTGFMPRSKK